MTPLVSVFDRLASLRSAVRGSEKFLGRIQRDVKALREIAFQVGCAVKCLSLIERHLLVDIVLARYAFLLFQEEVVSRSDLVVFVVLDERCRIF